MPLYEYNCRACGRPFEVLVSARSAAEPVRCPECVSPEVDRLIGLPAAKVVDAAPATNCRGEGPPCGAPWCGRKRGSD